MNLVKLMSFTAPYHWTRWSPLKIWPLFLLVLSRCFFFVFCFAECNFYLRFLYSVGGVVYLIFHYIRNISSQLR